MAEIKILIGTDQKFGQVTAERGSPASQDEPCFVIRGRDELAVRSLKMYRELAMREGLAVSFLTDIENLSMEFAQWAQGNPDQMHLPT